MDGHTEIMQRAFFFLNLEIKWSWRFTKAEEMLSQEPGRPVPELTGFCFENATGREKENQFIIKCP